MVEPLGALQIRVASLLERPRHLAPAAAEAVYRAGESLALGLDMALTQAGLKRSSLIAQRVNRVAFAEAWTPPGGWAAFAARLHTLAADAGPDALPDPDPSDPPGRILPGPDQPGAVFPHLLDHAPPPWYYVPRDFPQPLRLPEPRPQSHAGAAPGRILSVGSVPGLARELEALEPLLVAYALDPQVWFPAPLLEATAVSLETGLPIIVLSAECRVLSED